MSRWIRSAAVAAALAFAGTARVGAQSVPAAAPAAHPPACVPEVVGHDSIVDSLFAYLSQPIPGDNAEEIAFANAQARAVLALLPMSLVRERERAGTPSAPAPGVAQRWQADLLVWFQVRDDGSLAGMKLERPSPWPELDVALQRTILRADSLHALQPVPRGLAGHAVDLWLAVGKRHQRSAENLFVARALRVEERYAIQPTAPRFLRTGYRAQVPSPNPGELYADTLWFEVMVDTTGLVDARSIRPVRVRRPEYLDEAVRSARASLFTPGRVGACKVRARAELPVAVQIGR